MSGSDERKEVKKMKALGKRLQRQDYITLKDFCLAQNMGNMYDDFRIYLEERFYYSASYHKDSEWSELTTFADHFLTELVQ